MTDEQAKQLWMHKVATQEWSLFLYFTHKYLKAVARQDEWLMVVSGDIVCDYIYINGLIEGWMQFQRDRQVFPDAIIIPDPFLHQHQP